MQSSKSPNLVPNPTSIEADRSSMEPESNSSDPFLYLSPSPSASLNSTSIPSGSGSGSDSDSDRAANIYTFSNENPSNSDDSVHDALEEVTSYCTATAASPPSKRPKCTHPIQTLDRITQLPDSLLHQILSLLPIKDAVASGILSKRWRHTWTSMPNLIFKHSGSWDERISEFLDIVNNTVLLYSKSSNLKRFSLELEYSKCFASKITTWIRFATSRNVEEIDLNFLGEPIISFSTRDYYLLPQFLFDYKLVKSLNLRFCEIVPGSEIGWKLLKNLSIGCASLSNELVETILQGCPVLECLELYMCFGITRLDAKSTSLRKLVVKNDLLSPQGDMNDELEISGNNLRSLSLVGLFYRRKLKVVNVGSLVDVSLDFQLSKVFDNEDNYNYDYEEDISTMREIFDNIHHVMEVAVGKWCIQVLSMCELKAAPSPLSKHKLLRVDTYLKYWDLPGIARLLRSSPDLETLVLNMACDSSAEVIIGPNVDKSLLFGENDWASQEMRFSSSLLNLSTIEIVGFIADTYHSSLFVSLMQIFLKKAGVLKKMVIYPEHYDRNRWWMRGRTKDLLSVGQSLLSFPRSSSEAEILLHRVKDSLVKAALR